MLYLKLDGRKEIETSFCENTTILYKVEKFSFGESTESSFKWKPVRNTC